MSKVLTLNELNLVLEDHRKDGAKIVLAHGCFDLLHIGHIKHLQAAKKLGNILVVTVTADAFVNKGQGRPRFNQHLRADALAALDCVDYVAINHTNTAADGIRLIKPHVFVKGIEYLGIESEKDALKEYGGSMEYVVGENNVQFSSTELMGGRV